MKDIRNTHGILVWELEEKDHFRDIGIDKNVIEINLSK
jgi:hypothetical protein